MPSPLNEALTHQLMEAMRLQAFVHSASLLLVQDDSGVDVGSSTCIRIEERVFLATAGHNFDGIVRAEQIRIIPPNGSVDNWIPFRDYRCTKERGNSSIDVAWIELEPEILERTELQALTLESLKPREVPAATYRYLAQGAPAELASHGPFELGTEIDLVSLGYFTSPVLADEYPEAEDTQRDLILKYATGKTSLPVSGRSVDVPKPSGMSGGGVWTITNHPYRGIWSPSKTQLVGIVRAYDSSRGWLHCVRIHHWLNFLRTDFPDLAQAVDDYLDRTRNGA